MEGRIRKPLLKDAIWDYRAFGYVVYAFQLIVYAFSLNAQKKAKAT